MQKRRSRYWIRPIVYLSVLAVIALSPCSFAGVLSNEGAQEQSINPEEAYYRGVYDVCANQTHEPEFCLIQVEKLRRAGWYEKDSYGWEWAQDEDFYEKGGLAIEDGQDRG